MKFLAVYHMPNGELESHAFESDAWFLAAEKANLATDEQPNIRGGELILLTNMPPLVVHVVSNYLASLTPVCKNTLNLGGER